MDKSAPKYVFHVLRDSETVNAFALPGGQVFVTAGLLKHLTNGAQLAGVLAHEVGHVVGRHSAEHVAKAHSPIPSSNSLTPRDQNA